MGLARGGDRRPGRSTPRSPPLLALTLLLWAAAPSAAPAATPPAAPKAALAPWRLPTAHLAVALVCPRERPSADAQRTFQAAFQGPGRAKSLTTQPHARVPALDATVLERGAPLPAAVRTTLAQATDALVLDFTWPAQDTAGLLEASRAAAKLAEACDALVVDLATTAVLSAGRFGRERAEAAEGVPLATRHYAIRGAPVADGRLVLETVGLEHFGLAELALEDVPEADVVPPSALLKLVVQRLVEGLAPDAQGRLTARFVDLAEPSLKRQKLLSPVSNATGEVVTLLRPLPARPPAKGTRYTLTFPTVACGTKADCLMAATERLLGTTDAGGNMPHGPLVLAASEQARQELEKYRAFAAEPRKPGEAFLVKAPFSGPAGTDWVWVEVQRWEGHRLQGVLLGVAPHVPKLAPGALVDAHDADVFDYLVRFADGSSVGNHTGRAWRPELFEDAGHGRWRFRDPGTLPRGTPTPDAGVTAPAKP